MSCYVWWATQIGKGFGDEDSFPEESYEVVDDEGGRWLVTREYEHYDFSESVSLLSLDKCDSSIQISMEEFYERFAPVESDKGGST